MAKLPWWLNIIIKILIVDIIITLAVLVWSWLTKDFGMVSLSNRFFIGGIVAVMISIASGLGNWGHRTNWQQMLAQSATHANQTERNAQMMSDITKIYALTFVMIPAGLIAIVIAVILGRSA